LKTASIAYRVAEFLRRFPPFQYLHERELLELVSGGRVVFHEDDELVFEQGRRRRPYVYVVQQGIVRLIEVGPDGEAMLRDVRGEGDLLGIGRYLGIREHVYTARTETDVILYALPADLFWEQVKGHPRASRFLAAYFSTTISPAGLETEQLRSDELRLGRRPVDWMARTLRGAPQQLSCGPDTPVQDVAALLIRHHADVLAVTEASGKVQGLITSRQLCAELASGGFAGDTPAAVLATPTLNVAAVGRASGVYLTRMLETGTEHLMLTDDGRPDGVFAGIVTRRELSRTEGAEPLAIVQAMDRAGSISELAELLTQGQAALAAGLTGPESLQWLAPMATAFDAAVLRRVVGLVEGALAKQGLASPNLDHCWVFFGSAGRGELLTRYDLDHGLIYDEPEPERRRAARGYFLELGRRVSGALAACGFVTTTKAIGAGQPSACRSVAEWERAFSDWIGSPIESCVYRATSFFDLRPVYGDCRLVDRLEHHIHAEEDRNPEFVPLLVNDSMANLPPLTFFQGLVIDDEGGYTETLDLQRATLQPIVDIARALLLDRGLDRDTATLDRLHALVPENGDAALLIEETAAAFRNALYHRARTGYMTGSDGSRVDPSKLTRLEQNLLKAGFRTVLRLMEYMAHRYGLKPRRWA